MSLAREATIDLEDRVADRVLFSEEGVQISPGETYFTGELHGRTALFTVTDIEEALELAPREFSSNTREKLAKSGAALPDGSFPIPDCDAARRAIHAIGRANPSDRGKVRAHIRKRVSALGCSGSTFDNFK